MSEDLIYVGKAAMGLLVRRFNVWSVKWRGSDSPDEGAYELTEFLKELRAIVDLRLHLQKVSAEGERQELDLSALDFTPVEGRDQSDIVEAWLKEGATLVCDVSESSWYDDSARTDPNAAAFKRIVPFTV